MIYMNNTESELYIARTMLNAKTAVIADRENREQRIREKAVLTSLKRLNGGKTDDTQV